MYKFTITAKIFFIFAIALLLPSIFSLTVSIQPKNAASPAALYQYELSDFIIKVRNDADSEIKDVGIKVSVDPNLKIVEGYDELEFKIFKLPVMGPKEVRDEEIKIKPIAQATKDETKKLQITVDYGISSLTDYSGTYVIVVDSPLQIASKLVPDKINVGEDASIILNASNSSETDISNLQFELIGTDDFYLKETSFFSVAVLKENESIAEKQLDFKLITSKNKQNLILKTTFVDSIGEHALQKNFKIEEQPKTMTYVYVLIVIVLVLIAFTLMKILKEKKSPKPIADSHSSHESHGHQKGHAHNKQEESDEEDNNFEEYSENEEVDEDESEEDLEEESGHKHH